MLNYNILPVIFLVGIGYVTARELMLMGARVIMACRSPTKAKAVSFIHEYTRADLSFTN